ncbi:hypothetical protein [Sphingobacterium wenxiniae]|uniref:Uncharacterized protein n=1 Tax=Sphingobacterium wenxiniae TaxID=683125 RepID=A0A1I6PHJ5_9SPHI|nr:hypothetical protein [Sphingobacterium wenxiniae]SFS39650.1 hypothetical protein SAMN05660206_101472 [Sphingobacterium wenxiniae]
MKQLLNTAGVAQVEATILALPPQEFKRETNLLRQDLPLWLQRHVQLTEPEVRQLNEMPEQFKKDLAEAIALTWENGGIVSFTKNGEKSKDEENENPKDIFFKEHKVSAWRVGSTESTIYTTLSIEIVYR